MHRMLSKFFPIQFLNYYRRTIPGVAFRRPQSVQRWATGWTIGVLGFDSLRGLGIFLFTTVSRTVLGPTQPPLQWVRGALSLGVKRPEREADHSPPSSAEVKECVELYLHSPNTQGLPPPPRIVVIRPSPFLICKWLIFCNVSPFSCLPTFCYIV
jgi:hypothetical protein